MLVVWVFKGRKLTKIPAFSNTELLQSLGRTHKPARISRELNNSSHGPARSSGIFANTKSGGFLWPFPWKSRDGNRSRNSLLTTLWYDKNVTCNTLGFFLRNCCKTKFQTSQKRIRWATNVRYAKGARGTRVSLITRRGHLMERCQAYN